MPAAFTQFLGITNVYVQQVDLSRATQFRLIANVRFAGASGAKLRITDGSSNDLASVAGAGDLPIGFVGVIVTAWVDIAVAERADQALTLWGYGGDGAIDPTFANVRMEYR